MKKDKKGFLIIFVIIASFMFLTIALVIQTIISKDYNITNDLNDNFIFENYISTNFSTIMSYNKLTNSGETGDYFSCQDGVIVNIPGQDTTCTSEFIPGIDNIDDKCDNNDYIPSFYTGNINIDNYLSPDSKLYDNDSDSRINIIGFLYPNETKTVFQMNKDIIDLIQSNKNNKIFLTPIDTGGVKMNFDFNNIGTGGIDINIITLSKEDYSSQNLFIKNEIMGNISSLNGYGTIDEFGSIGGLTPFIFNLKENDYVINLKNNSSNIIGYKIFMYEGEIPIYIVPLKDDDNKYTYLQTSFSNNGGNIKYFKKVLEKKKN